MAFNKVKKGVIRLCLLFPLGCHVIMLQAKARQPDQRQRRTTSEPLSKPLKAISAGRDVDSMDPSLGKEDYDAQERASSDCVGILLVSAVTDD